VKLAVVIVNYNVKYFLEQCLHSALKSAQNVETEIWVVDNNSVDGSVEMVEKKFPTVKLIANKDNRGFSKANNQAIRESNAEYILLLNPDTVVEEDTFEKIVRFMDEHPDAGGLGVKMIDGSGKFLPESKRGLPTYDVAFYKIFGLSKIFPKSKTFGRYHLGFLDENETHQVEILAGAFMLMRKSVLDEIGLLDEDFFMYGEDIDLSYRIIKAGYKNYYFPKTRIIHYKGESTKRSSVNYVFVFYNAMIIFAKKHFSKSNASLFSFFIKIAIYLRAGAAIVSRFIDNFFLPICDLCLVIIGIFLLKNYWGTNFMIRYPDEFMRFAVPAYGVIWITSIFFSGGYDKPIKLSRIVRGIFIGTLLILVIYALLPETYRFSRALILLGAVWSTLSIVAFRFLMNVIRRRDFNLTGDYRKRLIIVGLEEESHRVLTLLKLSDTSHNFIGFVQPEIKGSPASSASEYEKYFLGNFNRLAEITEVFKVDEIIFCGKDISSQQIIEVMSQVKRPELEFKIAPPESLFIIGSNSVEDPGELYVIDINNINKSVNKRNKRFIDLLLGIGFFVLSPLMVLLQKNPAGFMANIFRVISGKVSWVGYSKQERSDNMLPRIRPGILNPIDALNNIPKEQLTTNRLNSLYAKDYKVYSDLQIIRKGWRNLGRKPV
jgi:GT2 family glycosyltransferase